MKGFVGNFFNWAILTIAFFVFTLPAFALTVSDFPVPHSQNGEPVERYWNDVVEVCTLGWHLDPYWVAGLVKKESWFDPNAVNLSEQIACDNGFTGFPCPYPGRGLMQITGPWVGGILLPQAFEYQYNMPAEARREEAPLVSNPFNPRENLDRGCWYLRALTVRYNGDTERALLAYRTGFFGVNAGTGLAESSYFSIMQLYHDQYLASASISNTRVQALLSQLSGVPGSVLDQSGRNLLDRPGFDVFPPVQDINQDLSPSVIPLPDPNLLNSSSTVPANANSYVPIPPTSSHPSKPALESARVIIIPGVLEASNPLPVLTSNDPLVGTAMYALIGAWPPVVLTRFADAAVIAFLNFSNINLENQEVKRKYPWLRTQLVDINGVQSIVDANAEIAGMVDANTIDANTAQ